MEFLLNDKLEKFLNVLGVNTNFVNVWSYRKLMLPTNSAMHVKQSHLFHTTFLHTH